MPNYAVEVRLNYTTGLPQDVAVNTFCFSDALGAADLDVVCDLLEDFYNVIPTGGTALLANYISSVVDRGANKSEMFVYTIGSPGPPVLYRTWTLGSAVGSGILPLEVALCLSFAGTTPGVPSARQRGRIYLGPLQANTAGTDGKPTSTFINNLAKAAAQLGAAATTNLSPWCVHSRVNGAAYGITHGWVDNEFDTQRRRQVPATSRTTYTV